MRHEQLNSWPSCFTPNEEPWYPQREGWVGKASLDILEKRKISCPCWDSNPKLSSPQHSHCNDYDNLLPHTLCMSINSYLASLNLLGGHDYDARVLLPDHVPEI